MLKDPTAVRITRRTFVGTGMRGGLAATLAGVTAPFGRAHAATEIPIGVVVGLTGAGADYGRDALRAFQLVIDTVNSEGGIKTHGGAKIKLHVADHQTDLRVTSSETERLITRNNVVAILGWAASGPARVGSEVAERYRYADGAGEIGIIASVTQPFCGDCTRARLSAEGRGHDRANQGACDAQHRTACRCEYCR